MAIERITGPSSLPLTTADYQAQNALIAAAILPGTLPFLGTDIKQGTVFNIGGVLYKATSDTAITGTASPYVKVTAAGATASAAFVASLAGVTWNPTYNGYYDGVDLVVFDEYLAVSTGVVATARTERGVSFTRGMTRLTSGAGNWTVPAGVTKIRVTCVGGGGNGGDGGASFGGGGGGGTNISLVLGDVLTVTPGDLIAYSVGGPGVQSTFTGATTGLPGLDGSDGSTALSGGAGPAGGAGSAGGCASGVSGGCGGGAGGAGHSGGNGDAGNYGGGGGGGGSTFTGGAGGSGIIIIEYLG